RVAAAARCGEYRDGLLRVADLPAVARAHIHCGRRGRPRIDRLKRSTFGRRTRRWSAGDDKNRERRRDENRASHVTHGTENARTREPNSSGITCTRASAASVARRVVQSHYAIQLLAPGWQWYASDCEGILQKKERVGER